VIRLVADENFRRRIVRGLLRREPGLDIVIAQDTDVAGADDPTMLEWAAHEGRIVLTHDVSTMTKHAYERVARGEAMPGVWEVKSRAPTGPTIDEILLLVHCSLEGEWEGQVLYLPL
jgi:hypothetical protein